MPDAYDRSRERWEPWQPEGMEMPVPEDPYELLSVAWRGDEFRVVFDGTNVRVVVIFDIDVVLSVRWAEESDRAPHPAACAGDACARASPGVTSPCRRREVHPSASRRKRSCRR